MWEIQRFFSWFTNTYVRHIIFRRVVKQFTYGDLTWSVVGNCSAGMKLERWGAGQWSSSCDGIPPV